MCKWINLSVYHFNLSIVSVHWMFNLILHFLTGTWLKNESPKFVSRFCFARKTIRQPSSSPCGEWRKPERAIWRNWNVEKKISQPPSFRPNGEEFARERVTFRCWPSWKGDVRRRPWRFRRTGGHARRGRSSWRRVGKSFLFSRSLEWDRRWKSSRKSRKVSLSSGNYYYFFFIFFFSM